jgi:hypothetical protein
MAQAQAIRTGRARSLGLVLNAGRSDAHKPFLTDFLDGISRAASEESWTLTVATAEDEADEVATMAGSSTSGRSTGSSCRGPSAGPRIALAAGAGVPFILYGRTADDTGGLRLVRHRRRRRDARPPSCAWRDLATAASAIINGGLPGLQLFAAAAAGFLDRDGRGRAGPRVTPAHGDGVFTVQEGEVRG